MSCFIRTPIGSKQLTLFENKPSVMCNCKRGVKGELPSMDGCEACMR